MLNIGETLVERFPTFFCRGTPTINPAENKFSNLLEQIHWQVNWESNTKF